MITIQHTDFKSNMSLSSLFNATTKDNIVRIITKLDEYISPNLKKDETARRAASIILHDPRLVLDDLSKSELQLVKEFVDVGSNVYIERKMRQTFYKLQKYKLVLTYEDIQGQVWKMLMPDELREAFALHIDAALAFKEAHPRKLSRKERSFMALMEWMKEK